MIACCDLCYAKYLDKDGSVLRQKLVDAIATRLVDESHQADIGPLSSKHKRMLRATLQNAAVPHAEAIADKMIANKRLCMCDCHTVGSNIMH